MGYTRPNVVYYRMAQGVSWLASKLLFRRKLLRNEIKDKTGPYVVIANHQCAFDFVNLIGVSHRLMSFVISNSFYNTLPIKGFLDKMGVIPKQQFQTTANDLKRMKFVIDAGEPLVIYPAGLMCEDGLSTPIPAATYKFLKWLDADVYVARSKGTYFVMPKWSQGFRPGRTTLDIYKLFSREELAAADLETVRRKTDEALLFDAYREQAAQPELYRHNHHIAGLKNVLYVCPHCKTEFSITSEGEDTLVCATCGFRHKADALGLLHNDGDVGAEVPLVSDWSRWIYAWQKEKMERGEDQVLSAATDIYMIDYRKHKFMPCGSGTVTLDETGFLLEGTLSGEEICLPVSTEGVPTLPFKPGKYLEIQHGKDIYRCVLQDGRLVMKFINMVKIFYELRQKKRTKAETA